MIRGFEEYTHDLTSEELEKAIHIADYLKDVKKEQAVSGRKLTSIFGLTHDSRARKIINYLRTEGHVKGLVANNAGYYMTDDVEDLVRYRESLLARAAAILKVAKEVSRNIIDISKKNEVA